MVTTDKVKLSSLACAGLVVPEVSWACFDCREAVEAQVYGADFVLNLLALILPLLIMSAVGSAVYFLDDILGWLRRREQQSEQ